MRQKRQAAGAGTVLLSVLLLAGIVAAAYLAAKHSIPYDKARLQISDLLSFELAAANGVKIRETQAAVTDPYWEMEAEPSPSHNVLQPSQTPMETQPQVLLYCTHSNEAYRKGEGDQYRELADTRTLDAEHNILKVASELHANMREQGLAVLYDDTDHELGKYYTTAYNRSLQTVQQRMEENQSLTVLFDIHRDASGESGKDDYVVIDGKECARIMIVVGTGNGKTGSGFDQRPDWEENLKFANAITKALREIHPDLARDVCVKTGRYNQHMSTNALAIEIGHNQNTLEQACNTTAYLAQAVAGVLGE